MTDCKQCKYSNDGCYCPPDKYCTAFEKKKIYVRHTYEFVTEEDWKPMSPVCWVDCPVSFMIGLGNHCKCLDGKAECPFVEKLKESKESVKHGHWVLLDNCSNEGIYCSECNKKVYKKYCNYANVKLKSKFCPNCGAIMDGEFKVL